jgi:hypothetical protein
MGWRRRSAVAWPGGEAQPTGRGGRRCRSSGCRAGGGKVRAPAPARWGGAAVVGTAPRCSPLAPTTSTSCPTRCLGRGQGLERHGPQGVTIRQAARTETTGARWRRAMAASTAGQGGGGHVPLSVRRRGPCIHDRGRCRVALDRCSAALGHPRDHGLERHDRRSPIAVALLPCPWSSHLPVRGSEVQPAESSPAEATGCGRSGGRRSDRHSPLADRGRWISCWSRPR